MSEGDTTSATAAAHLRVTHLISGDLWGGAECMAATLLRELQRFPLACEAILLNEGPLADQLRQAGVAVQVVPETGKRFWQLVGQVRRILAATRPGLIHAHRYKENILAVLAAPRGTPLITTQHGLQEGARSLAGRCVSAANLALLARRFAATVAVSDDLRRHLVTRCALPADRVEVIRNGIELPDTPLPTDCRGLSVVGSSGRLVPVKDFPLLIEIARRLARDRTAGPLRFEIAGEGPERPRIEALIAAGGLEGGVVLRGHLDDIAGFYRGLRVYLVTSLHEGIPMAVLEALAHGLPVVAPAVGGLTEIIEDGREGFLIRGRDPGAFADRCRQLTTDRDLWRRMSIAARARAAAHFSARAMAEQYCRLYQRVVPEPLGRMHSDPGPDPR